VHSFFCIELHTVILHTLPHHPWSAPLLHTAGAEGRRGGRLLIFLAAVAGESMVEAPSLTGRLPPPWSGTAAGLSRRIDETSFKSRCGARVELPAGAGACSWATTRSRGDILWRIKLRGGGSSYSVRWLHPPLFSLLSGQATSRQGQGTANTAEE
jgi:hypothetical protein